MRKLLATILLLLTAYTAYGSAVPANLDTRLANVPQLNKEIDRLNALLGIVADWDPTIAPDFGYRIKDASRTLRPQYRQAINKAIDGKQVEAPAPVINRNLPPNIPVNEPEEQIMPEPSAPEEERPQQPRIRQGLAIAGGLGLLAALLDRWLASSGADRENIEAELRKSIADAMQLLEQERAARIQAEAIAEQERVVRVRAEALVEQERQLAKLSAEEEIRKAQDAQVRAETLAKEERAARNQALAERDKCREELAAANKQITLLTQRIQELEEGMTKLENQRNHAIQDAERQANGWAQAEKEKMFAQNARIKAEAQVIEAQTAQATAETLARRLQAEKDKCQEDLAAAMKQIASLNQRIQELTKTVTKTESEKNNLLQDKQAAEEAMVNAEQNEKEEYALLEAAAAEMRKLKAEIEGLKAGNRVIVNRVPRQPTEEEESKYQPTPLETEKEKEAQQALQAAVKPAITNEQLQAQIAKLKNRPVEKGGMQNQLVEEKKKEAQEQEEEQSLIKNLTEATESYKQYMKNEDWVAAANAVQAIENAIQNKGDIIDESKELQALLTGLYPSETLLTTKAELADKILQQAATGADQIRKNQRDFEKSIANFRGNAENVPFSTLELSLQHYLNANQEIHKALDALQRSLAAVDYLLPEGEVARATPLRNQIDGLTTQISNNDAAIQLARGAMETQRPK